MHIIIFYWIKFSYSDLEKYRKKHFREWESNPKPSRYNHTVVPRRPLLFTKYIAKLQLFIIIMIKSSIKPNTNAVNAVNIS